MARDNKTLGRFELTGIPSAPRGMPQIEVTFDIDANGIVEVSAKDKASGKQQSIRITASSGLSTEEVDRLIQDAQMHTDSDRRLRDLIDARNQADALIYSTEKSLNELGGKVDGNTRMTIEDAISNLKQAVKGEDTQQIRKLIEILTQASHQLAQAAYQQNGPEGAGGYGNQTHQGANRSTNEDVVDADFEEVA
jgi:molecular chaperone DnaK